MTIDHVLPPLTQALMVKFSDKNVEEATQAIFKSSELRGNVEEGTSIFMPRDKDKPPPPTLLIRDVVRKKTALCGENSQTGGV